MCDISEEYNKPVRKYQVFLYNISWILNQRVKFYEVFSTNTEVMISNVTINYDSSNPLNDVYIFEVVTYPIVPPANDTFSTFNDFDTANVTDLHIGVTDQNDKKFVGYVNNLMGVATSVPGAAQVVHRIKDFKLKKGYKLGIKFMRWQTNVVNDANNLLFCFSVVH